MTLSTNINVLLTLSTLASLVCARPGVPTVELTPGQVEGGIQVTEVGSTSPTVDPNGPTLTGHIKPNNPTTNKCAGVAKCPSPLPANTLCASVPQRVAKTTSVCFAATYSDTIYYNPTADATDATSALKISLHSNSSIVIDAATTAAAKGIMEDAGKQDCNAPQFSSTCRDSSTSECTLIEQMGTVVLLPCTEAGNSKLLAFMVSQGYDPTTGNANFISMDKYREIADPASKTLLENVEITVDVSTHPNDPKGNVNMVEPPKGKSFFLRQLQATSAGSELSVSDDTTFAKWSSLQTQTNPVQISKTIPFKLGGDLCLSTVSAASCTGNALGATIVGNITVNAAISFKFATSFMAPLQAAIVVTHSGEVQTVNTLTLKGAPVPNSAYEKVWPVFELNALMPQVTWAFQLLESFGITVGPMLNVAAGTILTATIDVGLQIVKPATLLESSFIIYTRRC